MKSKFRSRWGYYGAILFGSLFFVSLVLEDLLFPDPFFGNGLTSVAIFFLLFASVPAAISGFVCAGILGGFWNGKNEDPKLSAHFQISLATMIVLVLAIGLLIWINLTPYLVEGVADGQAFGWPVSFIFLGEFKNFHALVWIKDCGVRASSAVLNFFSWATLLSIVAFIVDMAGRPSELSPEESLK